MATELAGCLGCHHARTDGEQRGLAQLSESPITERRVPLPKTGS